jgi:hypothetical protein
MHVGLHEFSSYIQGIAVPISSQLMYVLPLQHFCSLHTLTTTATAAVAGSH